MDDLCRDCGAQCYGHDVVCDSCEEESELSFLERSNATLHSELAVLREALAEAERAKKSAVNTLAYAELLIESIAEDNMYLTPQIEWQERAKRYLNQRTSDAHRPESGMTNELTTNEQTTKP
jgi:hypothetical protein